MDPRQEIAEPLETLICETMEEGHLEVGPIIRRGLGKLKGKVPHPFVFRRSYSEHAAAFCKLEVFFFSLIQYVVSRCGVVSWISK